jgi:hypothetical protein
MRLIKDHSLHSSHLLVLDRRQTAQPSTRPNAAAFRDVTGKNDSGPKWYDQRIDNCKFRSTSEGQAAAQHLPQVPMG